VSDYFLGEDPWGEDMLTFVRVEPWLVWLRSSRQA
jgi:hypothetical protein